ncbi:MAG TPA: DUF3306 domain-containing protein [Bradyrhizobium sp.]|nr:DUF3306 domain-containing protein [Bradyrhizobium sp.]
MSDEEFLARWSRRKQEARSGHPAPEPAEPMQAHEPTSPPATADDPSNPDLDLSSLPPIESIDAATDITAFLRKGIPQELSRAALRRAWTADPAIRDFVGLAENAWDFNDPNAMPGFGPLDCSDAELGELVDRIVGGVRRAAENLSNPLAESKDEGRQADSESHPAPQSCSTEAIADVGSTNEATVEGSAPTPAAPQPDAAQGAERDQSLVGRRTNGGALPR